MSRAGLVGRCQRKRTRTTFSDPEAKALDLVKRAFGPGTELDRTWVGDITYVRTWEGWLYLATVIDLASRRVVGWAMADHMRAELACDALAIAISARRPRPGLIFHSDRGSQYTSAEFTKLAKEILSPRASRGQLNAGTTLSARAGSPRSKTSSSTATPGLPALVPVKPSSSSSRFSQPPTAPLLIGHAQPRRVRANHCYTPTTRH